MKKKPFEIQKWMWLVGVPSLIGVVILFSRTVVTFADMPKRVDNIEAYVEAQRRANEINDKANQLMQQQIQQQGQQQQPVEWYLADDGYYYTKDGKFWWDDRTREWKMVKK